MVDLPSTPRLPSRRPGKPPDAHSRCPAVKGAVEGAKGKAKEVVGKVTDRDDLRREGQAQQDKADAQRDAGKKEAEAESARGAAKANEKREAAEQ